MTIDSTKEQAQEYIGFFILCSIGGFFAGAPIGALLYHALNFPWWTVGVTWFIASLAGFMAIQYFGRVKK